MNHNLDLNLYPVRKQAGREAPEIMRLCASAPQRGCARGRSADHLALALIMQGNSILSSGKQDQALEHLSGRYYKTPGSATTAMREVANELNSLFMKRNQHLSGTGKGGTGLLAQLVMRGNQLYMALSGPLHIYIAASNEIKHLYDPEMTGKSVGQIRYPPLWFTQATLHAGDTLILAATALPSGIEGVIREVHAQGPGEAIRQIFPEIDLDANALFIQVKSGKGALRLAQTEETKNQSEKPAEQLPPQPESQSPAAIPQMVQDQPKVLHEQSSMAETDLINLMEGEAVDGLTSETPSITTVKIAAQSIPEPPSEKKPVSSMKPGQGFFLAARRLAVSSASLLAAGTRRLVMSMQAGVGRVVPHDLFKGIPSSVMIVIVIAIPVIVVAAASQVYFSLGRQARNEAMFAQAVRQAEEAEQQTDMLAKKAGWENALDSLESVDDSPEVQALREQGTRVLDSLQLVKRIQFSDALGKNLPEEIIVTRLAVQGEDLFMLDGNSGNVMRAYNTSSGYVVDSAFTCGPNVQGVTVSGPLIDIVPWPAGFRPAAEVLAVDAGWNIQLCSKNEEPQIYKLAAPSNAAIGNLTGFALDLDDLYALDPTSNAVWIYWNNQMITAPEEEPYPFFKDEIPVLTDVIDLVVSNEELHLLHSDGHLTVCSYSGFKEIPTRCNNPAFIDFRPGYENMPFSPLPVFSQLVYIPPPEPSLYFLEPSTNGIYKFSVRSLAFQMKYLPAGEPTGGGATAFGIDYIDRLIYLAVGNEVYSASMP